MVLVVVVVVVVLVAKAITEAAVGGVVVLGVGEYEEQLLSQQLFSIPPPCQACCSPHCLHFYFNPVFSVRPNLIQPISGNPRL